MDFPKESKNMKKICVFLAVGCLAVAGCGSKVKGRTFHDNGGVVKIEFKSGGKAFVSTGPVSNACSYTESGNKVNLLCEGDSTIFTVEDDGALAGPPNGFMARLTPVKD
jgi:hypothetical protein